MNPVDVDALPFFAFGRGDRRLAFIGGGLILDSGEAENTFVFRCQDRFLVYTSLLGLPSVILVFDDAHGRRYDRLLTALDARLRHLAEAQGLPAPRIPAPLYVRCDLSTLALSATESFDRAARALAADGASIGFVMNQVSPTAARMLRELTDLLRERNVRVVFDDADCERVASLAQTWHNKARFMAFQREAAIDGGPPQVRGMVLAPDAFVALRDWTTLAQRFADACGLAAPPDALFLKSSQDSSGNVSAILSAATFADRAPAFAAEVRRWLLAEGFGEPAFVRELRAECALPPAWEGATPDDATLRALRQAQAARRARLPLIVQLVVRPPVEAGSPASVGVTLFVDEAGGHRVVDAGAQWYRDAQRRQFLGLHLDDAWSDDRRVRALSEQCGTLAGALAARGYRGPVNFDACLGQDGRYWFVGDCNPRLTAAYVPLAVRAWLRASGVAVRSISSFGYRGEFVIDHLGPCLDAWSEAGLLVGGERRRGLLILPNLARRNGHDALAINLDGAQAADSLMRMRRLVPQAVPAHLESIHD
ncbi:glutathione synthetase [Burkholderia sp. FERM BP-3421]|uniref:glutathione synthetase n=1 Tax=Burkholderia sp. FERM BP-3421 TaxID=1494466 RepID=UPI00235ED199|nr:glutathione synthetase [Burkholderia sp. FERM BP-3421]WDD94060.1 glutathione synthetase [Burkholderia sp. FERM BP-3421]